ncbi:MAG: repressor LexA, partial [Verrucomicrobiaceae bacterium]
MINSILSLTVREHAVLDFVRGLTARTGQPPVWHEVWGKFGFTSPGEAYFFLRDLE